MPEVTVNMIVERKTKNFQVFVQPEEPGESVSVGFMHLSKKAWQEMGAPNVVRVTVEAVD